MSRASRQVLPGFRLGFSTTLIYLALIVLIPLLAALLSTLQLSWSEFVAAVWNERARAAYRLTFSASIQAASINLVLGLVFAWTLVRYNFPGKTLLDALLDVPFALPTAVAGLVYASLYVADGWLGRFLVPLGVEVAYTRSGIVLVLIFTGLPFVVRTVQPVLEDLDAEVEQAAETLGANKWETFRRVIFPVLVPPALTGFTLALARSIGEYGSVVFISSNMPFKTEIAPFLIVSRLEEYAYREASAIAVVLLAVSFGLLITINFIERWSQPESSPRWLRLLASRVTRRLTAPLDWFVGTLSRRRSDGSAAKWVRRGLIGFTSICILALVALPLVNVFVEAFRPGILAYFRHLGEDTDTRHAIFLTLMIAPLAVAFNSLFGIAAAYTIARFRFPGRAVLTTLIDLPFSVSPVVAGLVFVLLFGLQSPLGSWLKSVGYQVLFAPPGLLLVTLFVTFPFVARELIPVLEANGPEEEIAARSLGANGWQMFWRVTMPNIKWGLIYGVILCNARAMGEFGAIYVVSGRISGQTDTMPLRVEKLFQEYNQPAAFALASLLTLLALITLGLKILVERKLKADQLSGPVR